MAFSNPSAIATAIAALSITVYGLDQQNGTTKTLTIRDLTNSTTTGLRPAEWPRNGPLLFPTYRFRSGYNETRASTGLSADSPVKEVHYTLNYYYAHALIGQGRSPVAFSNDISRNMQTICDAIDANVTSLGPVEVETTAVSDNEIITDPAGQRWYGGLISISVLDYRNF